METKTQHIEPPAAARQSDCAAKLGEAWSCTGCPRVHITLGTGQSQRRTKKTLKNGKEHNAGVSEGMDGDSKRFLLTIDSSCVSMTLELCKT